MGFVSDRDGIGDLKGIIQELDYLQSLGITAVWLNPIYSSPNADNGYDVSDYKGIMPEFGTMEDFEMLLEGMHKRGLKLIMDVVVNHSSDRHPWFLASRNSRDNLYRDNYHWWPAEKGTPPYRYSLFDADGDAWKYDSITDSYYLHYFSFQQPDLNWENPILRQEVYDIMHFWAQKGVDGFRLNAFQFAAKDTTFPEFPEGYERDFIQYYAMQPGLHDYLKEMNREVLRKYDILSVSEGAGRNFKEAHELVDAEREELQMAYAFEGVDLPKFEGYALDSRKAVFGRWDTEFANKGWLSIFLSNHDQARMVSRLGNDSPEFRNASASLLNTFILSMRGTPYCYYGDELGMTNIDFDTITQYNDIAAINSYQKALAAGTAMDDFMKRLNFTSRDNGRTPMQWTGAYQGGFTSGTPWLPVHENHKFLNVANQNHEPGSVLNHFRSLTRLRREHPVLVHGTYGLLDVFNSKVYAYLRTLGSERMLVLLNFSDEVSEFIVPEEFKPAARLIDNYPDSKMDWGRLEPWQAQIYQLK
ncbi:MAG: hypothetical protein RLZZ241_377 [Bacteroidota bacterium]